MTLEVLIDKFGRLRRMEGAIGNTSIFYEDAEINRKSGGNGTRIQRVSSVYDKEYNKKALRREDRDKTIGYAHIRYTYEGEIESIDREGLISIVVV